MIVAGVFAIAAVVLIWFLFDVLLLIFAGVLLAVVLRAPAAWIARRTRLSPSWALALVLVLLGAFLVTAGWMLGSAVKEQAESVAEQAPKMLQQVQERVSSWGWLSDRIDSGTMLEGAPGNFLGRGLSVISATFGAIANVGLVFFMAVLFAAQPDLYVRGTLRLVTKPKRERASQVLASIEETLRRWLLGQLVLMVFVGTLSAVGLWLLGVESALALGLLAGLLTFVPYVGPLVAAAVAILVSLADGITTAAWVTALYIGIQLVEGMLGPIVQQRAAYLPPVLLLVSQLALGVLVGVLGVIVATPLAAAAMVAVQMLYVEDILGDSMKSDIPAATVES